jgi:hypothetical protein
VSVLVKVQEHGTAEIIGRFVFPGVPESGDEVILDGRPYDVVMVSWMSASEGTDAKWDRHIGDDPYYLPTIVVR